MILLVSTPKVQMNAGKDSWGHWGSRGCLSWPAGVLMWFWDASNVHPFPQRTMWSRSVTVWLWSLWLGCSVGDRLSQTGPWVPFLVGAWCLWCLLIAAHQQLVLLCIPACSPLLWQTTQFKKNVLPGLYFLKNAVHLSIAPLPCPSGALLTWETLCWLRSACLVCGILWVCGLVIGDSWEPLEVRSKVSISLKIIHMCWLLHHCRKSINALVITLHRISATLAFSNVLSSAQGFLFSRLILGEVCMHTAKVD